MERERGKLLHLRLIDEPFFSIFIYWRGAVKKRAESKILPKKINYLIGCRYLMNIFIVINENEKFMIFNGNSI